MQFKKFGTKAAIFHPLRIDGKKNISIGNKVIIQYKTWLAAVPLTGALTCDLIIGDGTCIGNFNHIYATKSIIIGKNVLTADRVYISDNLHSYNNINLPIINQPIKQVNAVDIGDGSWIGENVCIIGANIGKNCVIGANSVVTKDIPDYCVVVGIPARIIKRYCAERQDWYKTDKVGNWI
jgi:acetyltransferase-like isoleucine patch superfamily enzyme